MKNFITDIGLKTMHELDKVCYIIIAGPQGAGKTTAQNHLKNEYQGIVTLKEAAQAIFDEHPNKTLGGALAVREVRDRDLARMREIAQIGGGKIYLDEGNVFMLAHAAVRGFEFGEFYPGYRQALDQFNTGIIFLDVPPKISWKRKQSEYNERYRGKENYGVLMKRSYDYLDMVYPWYFKVLERLPYPRARMNANLPMNEFKDDVELAFEGVCMGLGVSVKIKNKRIRSLNE